MRAGINGQQSSRTAGELKRQNPDPRPELAPPPKEPVQFDGKRLSFYLVEGVGLIEVSPGVTSGC